jgi:hypothetical protein
MNLSRFIRLWGFIDICYVIWIIYEDIASEKIPFFDSFLSALDASTAFDQLGITVLTVTGFVINLSVIVSGILMLMLNKVGVYVSLLQAPFRIFLIIPPTLFFLTKAGDNMAVPGWILIVVVMIVEVVKIVTELAWLKQNK